MYSNVYTNSSDNVFQLSHFFGTFVQSHHCSNQCFRNNIPSHCPFHSFPQISIKCFFLINKAHVQLLSISYVFFLYPYQNEDCINCTITWHKAELHIIYCYIFFAIISQIPFQQFSLHVLVVLKPISMSQFMTYSFALKIGIATLVAQSSVIPVPVLSSIPALQYSLAKLYQQ